MSGKPCRRTCSGCILYPCCCLLSCSGEYTSEKICLRYFKICLTYFEICQTYFFLSPGGVIKNRTPALHISCCFCVQGIKQRYSRVRVRLVFGSIYCFSHAFHAVCCRKGVEMYARHSVLYQVLALCRAPFHTKLAYFVVAFAFLYFDG